MPRYAYALVFLLVSALLATSGAARQAPAMQPESAALKERWTGAEPPTPAATDGPAVAPAPTRGPAFDVEGATEAYMNRMTPEARAKSDAYFEGGYWLQLWQFLFSSAVLLALLATGLSASMQRLAERVSSWRGIQALLYGVQFLVVTTVVGMPLSIYVGYFREHKYGLSNQAFGAWLAEQAIAFAVSAVFGGLAIMLLYAILRRVRKAWWLWASAGTVALLAVGLVLAPVYISPLFNKYEPMGAGPLRESILSLARANEIPADNVWVFDASKQSKRVSANVSGAFGTMRISLNDNLLNRCSPQAVEAVMGHEMGHYVLNHIYKHLVALGLVFVVGFAFTAWAFERIVRSRGAKWGIASVADPAGLPLIALLLGVCLFVMTPVTNSIIRIAEVEADSFGLNAARQPDGFAEAALMLSEYRKMRPGKWEEILFFDHPSGYNRIRMAMQWKAENTPAAP